MPGKSNWRRRRSTSGVMMPRSSAMIGSGPRASPMASNSAAPGPRTQRPWIAVGACAGGDGVVAVTAIDGVVTASTADPIVAGGAKKVIVASATPDGVVAVAAVDGVVVISAPNVIVAGATIDSVVSLIPEDRIIPVQTENVVTDLSAEDHVRTVRSNKSSHYCRSILVITAQSHPQLRSLPCKEHPSKVNADQQIAAQRVPSAVVSKQDLS